MTPPPGQPSPSPPTPQVVALPFGTTHGGVSGGAEPMILTDAAGTYVWIGDSSGGYYSTNNGTSWSKMAPLALGLHALNDGWALAEDENGNLYAADLSDNHIDVGRSNDGGRTWNQKGYYAGVSGSADRPWLAARGGALVLFYFDAPAVATGFFEHCARSTDGGLTFLDREPAAGPPQGGKAFYDANGHFYYSQSGGTLYRFASTCLAGAQAIPMITNAGVNNMIQADVEGTDLYMAAATGGAAQITLAGSHDGAAAKRIVVSPAELKANTYATVSVHGGQVAVAWYGSTTGGDPSVAGYSGQFDVYLSVVDDFWSDAPTVRTLKVSPTPNHSGYICMDGIGCTTGRGLLDYFMVDHDKWGGIHVAYADDTSGSSVKYVHVAPMPPGGVPPPPPPPGSVVADFSLVVNGLQADADASATIGATSYSWDWGDGTNDEGVAVSHTYEAPGTFTVTLVASDDKGTSDTHATDITVGTGSNAAPNAVIGMSPATPKPGQVVHFTDQSTDDGGIVLHAWDFGDGATSTLVDPVHTFAVAGTYTVRLHVSDAEGAADTVTRLVHVSTTGTPPTSTTDEKGSAGPSAVMGALGLLAMALLRRNHG